MEQVRIGIVGCGTFGESHLQAFRAIPSAKVVALFDADGERAAKIAAEFQVPRVCNSVEELCEIDGLDAVDVITPEYAHTAPVIHGLSRGKHIFVEKPLALDLRECEEMITASVIAKRVLMVGHLLRFETKYAMLKEELAEGRLGKVISMHARRNRPKNLLPRYNRTHPVLENCIHDIDLMLWYTQSQVKRVRGYGRSATGAKNHDTFWGIIEFESGAVGVVETIWLIPPSVGVMLDDAMEVVGDRGTAHLRLVPGSLELWHDSGSTIPDVCYDPRVSASARGALREELAYFCHCVISQTEPKIIRPQEAMTAVKIALALVASANSDHEIEIDMRES